MTKITFSNNSKRVPANISAQKKRFNLTLNTIKGKSPDILIKYIDYLYTNENLRTVNISTALDYSKKIYLFLEFLVENKIVDASDTSRITADHLDTLSNDDIESYLIFCSSVSNAFGEALNSASTIINKQIILKTFFKWLYLNEHISKNETEKLRKIQGPVKKSVVALSDDEVTAVLDLALNGSTNYAGQKIELKGKSRSHHTRTRLRDHAILIIFLHHGLRINELFNLNLSSINITKKEFTIFRKRDKKAKIYFTEKSLQALMEYINTERALIGEILQDDIDALFLNSKSYDRERLSIRQIREIVNKYTNQIFRVSPHKLRSTFATKALEITGNIHLVQQAMDHSNPNTTQVYIKENERSKKAISSIIKYD